MKSRTILLLIGAFLLASVGCDYFVDYTVINMTEGSVNSVYFSDPCADWMRFVKSDVGVNIPANSPHRFDGAAHGEPKCLLIRAEGLTYLTPYLDSTTYLVERTGNAAPQVTSFGASVEAEDRGSSLLGTIATGLIAIALLGGFVAAAVITIRYFLGQRPPARSP
jgi:hypothetical protein